MSNLAISMFKNVKTSVPNSTMEFTNSIELLEYFEENFNHEARENKDGLAIGFFSLKPNRGRKAENVIALSAVVLDIDKTTSEIIESALKKLSDSLYIAYTTHSHTADHPRWRIILMLAESMCPEHFSKNLISSRVGNFLGLETDHGSNTPSRIYYLPSHPRSQEENFKLLINKAGEPFDLSTISLEEDIGPLSAMTSDLRDKSNEEALKIVQEVFSGHLMFAENLFWSYSDGYWQSFEKRELVKFLVEKFNLCWPVSKIRTLVSVLESLKYETEFPKKVGDDVLVFSNCTLIPATREVIAHSEKFFAKNVLQFEYRNEATCPQWINFLQSCWEKDDDILEKMNLLQEFVGLCMVSTTSYEKMLWLVGAGSNGKSVILNIVRDLIGEENTSSVSISKMGSKFSLAQMVGKMINIDSEMSSTAAISDSDLKAVITGDVVTIEQKYEHPYAAKLTVKLLAATNNLPKTKDHSHGYFRRILPLTFNNIVKEENQDRTLYTKLKSELPGILNWSLEGLHRLQKNGQLTVPSSSAALLQQYKTTSNSAALFLEAHLKLLAEENSTPKDGSKAYEVYESYSFFCQKNGYIRYSNAEFGKRLKELGVIQKKSNGSGVYLVSIHGMEIYNVGAGYDPVHVRQPTLKMTKIEDEFPED